MAKLLSLVVAVLLMINSSPLRKPTLDHHPLTIANVPSPDDEPDSGPIICTYADSIGEKCKLIAISHRRDRLILNHAALGRKRIVAFYGSPLGRGLGVLGNSPPETMLKQLRAQADDYQKILTGTQVIPAFHMVVTVADKTPGDDKEYNHRVNAAVIQKWIDWAKQENVWVILDIQAGRGDVLQEVDLIEPFLYEPHVQLAIDPEFIVGSKEIPGENLGVIDGETINRIQSRLDGIARTIGQTKVLIVHQFDDRMLKNKDQILNYENVELVWDADGYGSTGAKIQDYNQYRHEPGFDRGGIKLFYVEDTPLMTPQQVTQLQPLPSIIIYQ